MQTAIVIKPFAMCMTGISGSGKSTIANAVAGNLKAHGFQIDVIDGDETRNMIGGIFGHSKEERHKMSRVNQTIGRYLLRNNVSFILAVVSPFESIRRQFREFFGNAYIEVYVKASSTTCVRRDVKGLYQQSAENLNGFNDDFDEPKNSDIVIDTENLSVEEARDTIIKYLKENKYI